MEFAPPLGIPIVTCGISSSSNSLLSTARSGEVEDGEQEKPLVMVEVAAATAVVVTHDGDVRCFSSWVLEPFDRSPLSFSRFCELILTTGKHEVIALVLEEEGALGRRRASRHFLLVFSPGTNITPRPAPVCCTLDQRQSKYTHSVQQ